MAKVGIFFGTQTGNTELTTPADLMVLSQSISVWPSSALRVTHADSFLKVLDMPPW